MASDGDTRAIPSFSFSFCSSLLSHGDLFSTEELRTFLLAVPEEDRKKRRLQTVTSSPSRRMQDCRRGSTRSPSFRTEPFSPYCCLHSTPSGKEKQISLTHRSPCSSRMLRSTCSRPLRGWSHGPPGASSVSLPRAAAQQTTSGPAGETPPAARFLIGLTMLFTHHIRFRTGICSFPRRCVQ